MLLQRLIDEKSCLEYSHTPQHYFLDFSNNFNMSKCYKITVVYLVYSFQADWLQVFFFLSYDKILYIYIEKSFKAFINFSIIPTNCYIKSSPFKFL